MEENQEEIVQVGEHLYRYVDHYNGHTILVYQSIIMNGAIHTQVID